MKHIFMQSFAGTLWNRVIHTSQALALVLMMAVTQMQA